MAPETTPQSSNKRKRESVEPHENVRNLRSHNTNGGAENPSNESPEMAQLQQQLLQEINPPNGVRGDENTRTAQAALATPMQGTEYASPNDTSFETPSINHGLSFGDDPSHTPSGGIHPIGSTAHALYAAREAANMNSNKPAVGTPQWHQLRKDNHKEVERRRRETINEGINEIAKIVPNCEKNKGSILQRAVEYIREFMQKEHNWSVEKGTLDTAVRELSFRFDKMKESAERAWEESNKWQRRCKEANLDFDDYDESIIGSGGGGGNDGVDPAAK